MNSGCLLSGLDRTVSEQLRHLPLTSDIIVQGHRVNVGELKLTVFTVFGAHDRLEVNYFFLCNTRKTAAPFDEFEP